MAVLMGVEPLEPVSLRTASLHRHPVGRIVPTAGLHASRDSHSPYDTWPYKCRSPTAALGARRIACDAVAHGRDRAQCRARVVRAERTVSVHRAAAWSIPTIGPAVAAPSRANRGQGAVGAARVVRGTRLANVSDCAILTVRSRRDGSCRASSYPAALNASQQRRVHGILKEASLCGSCDVAYARVLINGTSVAPMNCQGKSSCAVAGGRISAAWRIGCPAFACLHPAMHAHDGGAAR